MSRVTSGIPSPATPGNLRPFDLGACQTVRIILSNLLEYRCSRGRLILQSPNPPLPKTLELAEFNLSEALTLKPSAQIRWIDHRT